MRKFKYRVGDVVIARDGENVVLGTVIGCSASQGFMWYRVKEGNGDVWNCREDELTKEEAEQTADSPF